MLKTPDGTVLGKTTVTGDYGDTPSYTPPTIPGYTLTKTPTINPLNDDDTPTYEYEYTPKTETATVKAEVIDANGNPTGKYLQIDSSYKYPIEQSGPFNSSYKFGIPVLSGTDADEYMYAGSGQASDSEKDYYDPESGIVTGVYMDDTNTVTYYFREKPKPITPTVPVTPSTPDDGKNGNDGDKTNTGNGGDTTTPATPTTPETPDAPTKNPTITPDPNFVMGSATIEYVYADGSQAAEPGAQSGRVGADYGFDAPDKPGYTKTVTGDALSGILGDQPKHIIVTYTPIEQTIEVHHVDEQGNKLADDTTMTGVTGDTATAEA
ncbi:MucBP domain-containing protein, partial [Lactococcus garvieae]|uniref:MucBP domain-containing protein n=1 Tax=Lactococcus garvieae TaxID=1363 RepID=UPI00232BFF85